MSTEQEDAALLLELEVKITRRIREQIYMMLNGYDIAPGLVSSPLDASVLRSTLASSPINNPHFVTELTKKIGAKMANVY
jgi:hypothetical protein